MSALYVRLWAAISAKRRAQLAALMAITLLASAAEVFSIGAVLPFLGVLTALDKVFAHACAQPLIAHLGITLPQGLLWPATALRAQAHNAVTGA